MSGDQVRAFAKAIWRRDGGASLVEFALLIPFLLSLMIGIIEMSNVFYTRSMLNEAVRDATRRFAVGALDQEQTKTVILRKLVEMTKTTGDVQVTESDVEGENTDVTVALSVPLRDLLLFRELSGGLISFGGANPNITLSATMLRY